MPKHDWETWLSNLAQELPYPPTPQLTASRSAYGPRRKRVLVLLLVLLLSSLLVPQVRAAVGGWLRIGTVDLTTSEQPGSTPPPAPTPGLMPDLAAFGSLVDLETVEETLGFSLTLPVTPSELGRPTFVFLAPPDASSVLIAWTTAADRATPTLLLQVLPAGIWGQKMVGAAQGMPTTVGSAPAAWIEGPHAVTLFNPQTGVHYEQGALLQANTLLWATENATYRLETTLTLTQAQQLAETIQP